MDKVVDVIDLNIKVVDIVVGVLKQNEQYLVTQRQAHQDLAGFWEFPGGKIKVGETPQQALTREFVEEVGVEVFDWQPLIEIPWTYEHKTVRLKVFTATRFEGEAFSKEGQQLQWVDLETLLDLTLPPANQGILKALELPSLFMVTGDLGDESMALQKLKVALEDGVRIVQLRIQKLDEMQFINFAQKAVALCHQFQAICLLSGKPEWLERVPEADGILLSSAHLMHWVERPISKEKWLGASCHHALEVAKAISLQADFLLLSPVNNTSAHPDMAGMGWAKFADLVGQIPVPVYAYGGVKPEDVTQAIQSGGQGIAATSGLWPQIF